MRRPKTYRPARNQKADISTLGLLIVLIIVVFVALTFGEAEGVTHILKHGSICSISSL